MAQSVWRLAAGWIFRGSYLAGGEIFLIIPGRPWRTLSLPRLKWPGRGVDQPLLPSAGVKERVELYSTPVLVIRGLFWGEIQMLTFTLIYIC